MDKLHLSRKLTLIAASFLLGISSCFAAGSAFHYQLELSARLVTSDKGELTAVQMSWLYDAELSEVLMDGEDLSEAKREETLKRRAADILEGLKGMSFFTTLKVEDKALVLKEVSQYNLKLVGDKRRLQLNLTLPLATAQALKGQVLEVIVSDPSAVGLATFINSGNLLLEEPLKSSCKPPQLVQSKLAVIDEHTVISETMTVDCR